MFPRLPVNPVLQSDLSLVKDTSCLHKLSQHGDSWRLIATGSGLDVVHLVQGDLNLSRNLVPVERWFRPSWLQNSTTICMLVKEVLLDRQGRIWMNLGCRIQVSRFRKTMEIHMSLSLLGALDRHFFTLLHVFQSLRSNLKVSPFNDISLCSSTLSRFKSPLMLC